MTISGIGIVNDSGIAAELRFPDFCRHYSDKQCDGWGHDFFHAAKVATAKKIQAVSRLFLTRRAPVMARSFLNLLRPRMRPAADWSSFGGNSNAGERQPLRFSLPAILISTETRAPLMALLLSRVVLIGFRTRYRPTQRRPATAYLSSTVDQLLLLTALPPAMRP